jgi:Tfp pilus assembly ATPase PilU
MKTMDAAVVELYRDGEINRETAVRHMLFPQNLPKVV